MINQKTYVLSNDFSTDTTSLIFETGSLSNASPSAVSRCTVVHCGETTMNWSALYHTWKQTAKARWLLTAGRYDMGLDSVTSEFQGKQSWQLWCNSLHVEYTSSPKECDSVAWAFSVISREVHLTGKHRWGREGKGMRDRRETGVEKEREVEREAEGEGTEETGGRQGLRGRGKYRGRGREGVGSREGGRGRERNGMRDRRETGIKKKEIEREAEGERGREWETGGRRGLRGRGK